MEERYFIDWSNDDEKIYFRSDASQNFINAISFSGNWAVVKDLLIKWGHRVMDGVCVN